MSDTPSTSAAAVPWSDIHETPNLQKARISFTSGSTVKIQASAEKVFAIITAFDKYGEWNTWCPKFEFKEGEKIGPGSTGTMYTRMEAQKKDYVIPEKILQLESTPEKHILSWQGQLLPSWMGLVERVQEVTPSEDGQSCTLKSWESFAGWISYIFKYAMGIPKQLEESNVRYSNDLKAYAEKLYREGSSNTS